MGIYFFILFLGLAIIVVYTLYFDKKKPKKIKKADAIDDGMLFDPETGCLITLEQAQSGNWNEDDCKKIEYPDLEKEQLIEVTEYFKNLNIKKVKQRFYEDLEDENEDKNDISELFSNCETLKKYKYWYCNEFFEIDYNSWFIFLNVKEKNTSEDQILLFIEKTKSTGHYQFLENDFENKLLKFLHPEKELLLDNYITNTIKKSRFILENKTILNELEGYKKLDIEFFNGMVLIKSKRPICIEDAKALVEIKEKLIQFYL